MYEGEDDGSTENNSGIASAIPNWDFDSIIAVLTLPRYVHSLEDKPA